MSRLAEPTDPQLSDSAATAPHVVARTGTWHKLLPYLSIARPDHWIKNSFMGLGVLLAFFYYPNLLDWEAAGRVLWALMTTCLAASSNYVLNEILDAPKDRHHPVKHARPIPSGQIRLPIAYIEWLLLGGLAMAAAWQLNVAFAASAAALLFMGLVYNVPPVRSKELPYVDVLSESVNNPLRLLLGWFAVTAATVPPVTLMVFYWMIGAFFMASKRFAEYRSIGDPVVAASYRGSFRHCNDQQLLISMFFYATAAALFLGMFIIRYHLELILSVPLIAGFFSMYMRLALKKDSAAQSPERLYREAGLMIYLVVCVVVFVWLMFVEVRYLHELFNVPKSDMPTLWQL
ncbi:MAG: UbiA prenyltransferase family protein [Pirellulales bacterium]|nr:UbiA prenyltransferase family protein [Pirellulales bacterium]